MKEIALLQNVGHKIEKWLKENNYSDECISTCCGPLDEHLCRAMDFEYNGNVDDLDVDKLSASIAENVIDDRFSVRVSTYKEEYVAEGYENMFCVEVWFNN